MRSAPTPRSTAARPSCSVSGVLEDQSDKPLVGMERFFTGEPPYDRAAFPEIADVAAFLAGPPDRRVWSRTVAGAPAGLQTASTHHGEFDNDPETLASLS